MRSISGRSTSNDALARIASRARTRRERPARGLPSAPSARAMKAWVMIQSVASKGSAAANSGFSTASSAALPAANWPSSTSTPPRVLAEARGPAVEMRIEDRITRDQGERDQDVEDQHALLGRHHVLLQFAP